MKYLTIKEASTQFGKSESTIRRLIKILQADKKLEKKWLKKEPYKATHRYLIAKKGLRLEFGEPLKTQVNTKQEEKEQYSQPIQDTNQTIIQNTNQDKVTENLKEHIKDLQKQLGKANKQIERLDKINETLIQSLRIEQIKTLSEDDKEKIIRVLKE